MTNERATHEKIKREPLFHIVKRDNVSRKDSVLIRVCAVAAALIISGIVLVILTHKNPFLIYAEMFKGAFGTPRRIWKMLQRIAILLCLALAVTPAFRMKFWNCGAEGQALMGGLGTIICMFYLGGKVPQPVLVILMIIASMLFGAIWAVIPAVFKAKWNTNETLFTLMMNYIAIRLVAFFIKVWATDGSGILRPMDKYGLPKLFGQDYLLNIVIVALLTAAIYIYLNYSKHGYEISVVGESTNTAKYIGINVKSVIIRTMVLSGVLCGIAGLLLVGGTDCTINTETVGGQGFTAIMVSWLAKFNPIYMILTSFLIIFLQLGSDQISTVFRINNSVSDIVTGIILFFIIGSEFFINYKVVFRHSKKKEAEENK